MRSYSRLLAFPGGLLAALLALAACAADGAAPVDGSGDAGSNAPNTPATSGASSDGGGGDKSDGSVEPPPPPCDDAQTAAIKAAFEDETTIPSEVGAVALVKDPSCGLRYFTRGASKDVPQTALHLIGSATKTYVASLTLLLAEEGKLSLSDPVTKWIPDVPGGEAVKVEHLLNHTGGISNYTGDFGYMLGVTLGLKTKYTPRALLDLAFKKAPSFVAGTPDKWEYSNTNYVILGMIIESVTGKGLAEVLRERILTPIGAKATFFYGTETPVGDIAFGKTFLGSNGATFMDPSASWACGNLVASIGDLVDWEERRGNGTFHSPAMQAQLLKGVPTGADFTYGAALVIVGKTDKVLNNNGPAIGHGGDIWGYHTIAYYFPEKKATLAVIVDSDKGPSGGFPLSETYLAKVYDTVVNPYFGTTPKQTTP